MTNGADATPMNDRNSYDSHNGPVLTDMWFRGETSIRNDWLAMLIRSVSCDPLDVRYAMLADDHRKSVAIASVGVNIKAIIMYYNCYA